MDTSRSYEELREAYTVSPSRNPDGLGVFEAIEPRSHMTLWLWELEAKREDANRIAYARSADEQTAVLAKSRDFLTTHVVFEGVLLSTSKDVVDARWYLPEGVYLVDDQGRKFKPEAVAEGELKSERLIYMPPVSQYTSTTDVPRWVTGYPRIVFPAEAIGPATRSLTLYFAAASQRFSFTWNFAAAATPGRVATTAPEGMSRLVGRP